MMIRMNQLKVLLVEKQAWQMFWLKFYIKMSHLINRYMYFFHFGPFILLFVLTLMKCSRAILN